MVYNQVQHRKPCTVYASLIDFMTISVHQLTDTDNIFGTEKKYTQLVQITHNLVKLKTTKEDWYNCICFEWKSLTKVVDMLT